MPNHSFNKDKSLSALLFICEGLGGDIDLYSLLKILYFAEQKHLVKYGRSITGDSIIAMQYGPVPSSSYNLVKPTPANKMYFYFGEQNIITCKIKSDMDFLSESDINCLSESILENKDLSFRLIKDKSHEKSYEKAWAKEKNSVIPYIDIAIDGGASEELVKYIALNIENENLIIE